MNALGGSQDVTFERDPQTGKMVTHMTPSTPGMQWKRIISGAFTGFAGAQEAGTQGPGGVMRGFGGGVRAGIQRRDQQEQTMRSNADEDYKQQLETATTNLRTSMLQNQIADATFRRQQLKTEADDHDIQSFNNWQQMVSDSGGQVIGAFDNAEDAQKFAVDHPEVMKHFVGGTLRLNPNIVNGQHKGIIAAVVPLDFRHQPSTRDYKFPITETKEGPDGKPQDVPSSIVVPAGTKMGDILDMQGTLQKEHDLETIKNKLADIADKRANAAVTTSQAAVQRASAAGVQASAAYRNAQTRQGESPSRIDLNMANAAAKEDSMGDPNVEWGNGGYKQFEKWNDKFVRPVSYGLEKTYELSRDAYNAFQEQQRTGQLSTTGAASMQMFANHMQLTFGQVKGMRQGQQMMEQHLGARSLSGSAEAAFNKLVNGDVLTKDQWTDFFHLIERNRNTTWDQIQKDADSEGRPYQYIAFPNDVRQKYGMPPLQRAVPRQAAPAAAPAAATPPAALAAPGTATPANNPPPPANSGLTVSLAKARALPENKGKTDDQIKADIESHGHKWVQ